MSDCEVCVVCFEVRGIGVGVSGGWLAVCVIKFTWVELQQTRIREMDSKGEKVRESERERCSEERRRQ